MTNDVFVVILGAIYKKNVKTGDGGGAGEDREGSSS